MGCCVWGWVGVGVGCVVVWGGVGGWGVWGLGWGGGCVVMSCGVWGFGAGFSVEGVGADLTDEGDWS